jgi:putative endonuclease
MYTVYVLYSTRYDKIYIGMTSNLKMRLFAYNNLPKGWTRKFRPWELIYYEEFDSKTHAMERENALKSYQGREFVRTKLKER